MSKTTITIVGAGMAGLLCANLLKPGNAKVRIVEAQPSLPNNHSAVLRFRTSKVADALGISFTRVNMIKDVVPWRNPVADALAYSRKNSGIALSDRSITAGQVVGERFIAPPNFIQMMFNSMPSSIEVEFAKYWQPQPEQGPVISTLPMPVMMKLLNYPGERIPFYSSHALTVRAQLRQCNAYTTLMFPDPNVGFSRASITGSELIVEVPNFNFDKHDKTFMLYLADQTAACAASHFGFEADDISEVSWHKQSYAKILPIDERVRKHFMYWGTHNHNMFSLGRFATWRPGLLLDDLVKDIGHISNWIGSNDMYSAARAR